MEILNTSTGARQDAEGLAGDLEAAAEIATGTNLADVASFFADQVRAALAADGDVNENIAAASAQNPDITNAAVYLVQAYQKSCAPAPAS